MGEADNYSPDDGIQHKLIPEGRLAAFFKNTTHATMEASRVELTQILHKTSKLVEQVRKGIL